jgi:RNA polymerase sigma-70 factor (ECF subfamily)
MTEDRARFEAMFTANYAPLLRYALRRVGPDGAHEIVAETFLVAWRRLDAVPENALPWLYGTARRLVANELRRRARALRLGERAAAETPPAPDDPGEIVPDRLRVRGALAGLSARDQEVLRLAEWEQLDAADAARVLGTTTAAYTVRLHRARRRLARALGVDDTRPDLIIARGEPS